MPRYRDLQTGEILDENAFNALPESVEGVTSSIPQTQQPEQKKVSFLQRTGEIATGVGKFFAPLAISAPRIFKAGAFRITPEGKQLEERITSGQASPEELKVYQDVYGKLPSGKQLLGETAQTALTAATFGGIGVGGKLLPRVLKSAGLGAGFAGAGQLQEEEKKT